MPSAYIAQITGSIGNYQVAAIQQAALSDIPADQQKDWRDVELRYPKIDNSTQIMTSPKFSVNADGSVVSMTFNVENLPAPWAAMNLARFAEQQKRAKADLETAKAATSQFRIDNKDFLDAIAVGTIATEADVLKAI